MEARGWIGTFHQKSTLVPHKLTFDEKSTGYERERILFLFSIEENTIRSAATMPRRSCRNCMFLLVLLVSAWPNEGSTNECDKIVERAVDLGGQGDMAGGGRPCTPPFSCGVEGCL